MDEDITAADLADMLEYSNTDGSSDIDWGDWITGDAILTAAEAVRLMAGLDPDLFPSLEIGHNEHAFEAKKRAKRLERRTRSFKAQATPAEWLDWAASIGEAVHFNFGAAVDRLKTIGPCNAGGIAAPDEPCVVRNGGYAFFHSAPSFAETHDRSASQTATQPVEAAEIPGEPKAQATQIHLIKNRRQPLDSEIEMAQSKAANPGDPQSIWDALCAMADRQETKKLLGLDEDGIKYRDDKGGAKWLSKRAFMARMKRRYG
ncbi:hypothetical protein PQR66_19375 [Paraburkholderia agricolaris]|uniref:Uncharacterized protein n=1 Tax=Paraburkholderia agricolaris TaxID=2152888 RepID=A0ABW8ZT32_9BURK